MKHCTQCGHVLGLGRFCTNCGHPVAERHADPLSDPLPDPLPDPLTDPLTDPVPDPVPDPAPGSPSEPLPDARTEAQDWRGDTAERLARPAPTPETPPATAPLAARLPPAVGDAPPPPRFPLYADEVTGADAPATAPATAPAATPDPTPATAHAGPPDDNAGVEEWTEDDWDEEDWDEEDWDDRRSRAPWVVAGALLLTAVVLGGWFLGKTLGGDDDPSGDRASDTAAPATGDPVDRTAQASAEAPRTAPSTQDVDGNPTSYDASNMLDGAPGTAWRVAGDGAGLKLVFTFPERTRISEVGLVNGYAKTATDGSGTTFDWYAGHRRLTEVTWRLGAGKPVQQVFEDTPELQTVEVDPVEVRKVVLTIVATTAPGEGPARRDFTAISDVFLAG